MSQSNDFDSVREQSYISIEGLQCVIDVRDCICDDDLSAGIYVSRHTAAADLHEVMKNDRP